MAERSENETNQTRNPAPNPAGTTSQGGLGRRDFLRGGVAATLGAAAMPLAARAQGDSAPGSAPAGTPARAQVRRYRRLGRTELEISDISFGAARLRSDERLVNFALERGINYFDTAESYRGGDSETTIGRALKSKRDQFYLTSKVQTRPETPASELMAALDGSLKRLQTDYVDIYFNHAVNEIGRFSDDWAEFTAKAKQQGKIRWTGMSGHAGRLAECLEHVIDGDLVDVLLVGYNFGQDPAFYQRLTRGFDRIAIVPELPRLLHKAKQKDMGVVAMKTLMGARLNDMKPYEKEGGTFPQAAFRWTLSNPDVDALIVSMQSTEQVEEYLVASGDERPTTGDMRLLERYSMLASAEFCRIGCGGCLNACPAGVPIGDVLRSRMYAVDYEDAELAAEAYGELPVNASACATCTQVACAGACGYGLDIAKLTRQAHSLLG